MDDTQLILKGLGKRKVKAILNRWIKDQINRALKHNYEVVFDASIWLGEYCFEMYSIDLGEGEPYDVDDLFKFIGNKI
tara:strand:+ start:2303 stop:2536 length:234 start_codon:yes stop_codon:yes gene_type:complete